MLGSLSGGGVVVPSGGGVVVPSGGGGCVCVLSGPGKLGLNPGCGGDVSNGTSEGKVGSTKLGRSVLGSTGALGLNPGRPTQSGSCLSRSPSPSLSTPSLQADLCLSVLVGGAGGLPVWSGRPGSWYGAGLNGVQPPVRVQPKKSPNSSPAVSDELFGQSSSTLFCSYGEIIL